MSRQSALKRAVAVALLAAATAACSQASPVDNSLEAQDIAFYVQAADHAESSGASSAQVDLLRSASRSGTLTSAQVEPLLDALFACVESFGASGRIEGSVEIGLGVFVPHYVLGIPNELVESADGLERVDVLIQECEEQTMAHAWRAIQLRPSNLVAREQQFLAERRLIVECLRQNGRPIDEEATYDEVVLAAMEVLQGGGPPCMAAGQ